MPLILSTKLCFSLLHYSLHYEIKDVSPGQFWLESSNLDITTVGIADTPVNTMSYSNQVQKFFESNAMK